MSNMMSAIFSAEFAFSVLRVTTPLLFAALAALICNQGGILHIAFEGIMLFSAFCGVVVSAFTGSLLLGMLGGMAGGVFISVMLGYFHLKLKANIVLTGIALNTFASGGTTFMLYLLVNDKGTSQSLPSLEFPTVHIPLLKDIPVLGQILSGHSLLTYLSLLFVAVVAVLIFKTPLGLRIRTVGESPDAASSVGIDVNRIKFITLILSGIVASLGGMYMSMSYLKLFSRDMVAGRGFIGIAAQNLGAAQPVPTMLAALVFGLANALSNVLQTLNVPAEFVQAIPYVVTLLGLVAYSQSLKKKKGAPAKAR